jgi:aromatic ring-opening dioxygenase catalytic subunit (LigB family)
VAELLQQAGLPAKLDERRGFDHGVFIPFKLIYPDADIPVVQMSLRKNLDPEEHIRAGRALAALRDEGVLIVGSGMSYHNLAEFFKGGLAARDASAFDDWLTQAATSPAKKRDEMLARWDEAPAARKAHPREEHLLPLMVAAGAAGADTGLHSYADTVMGCAISGYRFG